VTQIDASRFDPGTAYISVSRFRVDDLTPLVFRTHDGGRTWTKITRGLADNASVNVVRADPLTKGLLFAGTERDVYVSFNDGDDWQPLTLNLPHSSVRDLIVHGDDLAIATHGRGFWILGDMTPLRELRSLQPSALSPAHLHKPQVAHRLRRDNWTDTPLPPEFPAGRNPPDGAIIDYYLAADARGPVTLEIVTSAGQLVRRYSSDDVAETIDEKSINVPLYWVRPPQTLSAATGMHRFVWDLRYPRPGAVQRDFPISAIPGDTPLEPLGVLAVPGAYLVKLTAGGTQWIQPLTLKMDPRASITPLGLTQQFTLATKIADMMNRSFAAISASPKPQAPSPTDDLIALNTDLATAYDVVEGSDRAPTRQAAAAVAQLELRLKALIKGTP
jgi:hypothetical protein